MKGIVSNGAHNTREKNLRRLLCDEEITLTLEKSKFEKLISLKAINLCNE